MKEIQVNSVDKADYWYPIENTNKDYICTYGVTLYKRYKIYCNEEGYDHYIFDDNGNNTAAYNVQNGVFIKTIL